MPPLVVPSVAKDFFATEEPEEEEEEEKNDFKEDLDNIPLDLQFTAPTTRASSIRLACSRASREPFRELSCVERSSVSHLQNESPAKEVRIRAPNEFTHAS